MGIYWADVQLYPSGDMRITKEVTLMDISSNKVQHFVFKPPFPQHLLTQKDLKTSNYIHSVLGVLHWSVGIQSLAELATAVPMKSVLICNGSEKVSLLKQLMPHVHAVFNVDVSCSHLSHCDTCAFPVQHKLCSHSNCMKLNKYFNLYFFGYQTVCGEGNS